jgi:hypothetical protein
MTISIDRVRELMGADAEGATDEQLGRLRDSLTAAASQFYEDIQVQWRDDPDSVRWFAYVQETGE